MSLEEYPDYCSYIFHPTNLSSIEMVCTAYIVYVPWRELINTSLTLSHPVALLWQVKLSGIWQSKITKCLLLARSRRERVNLFFEIKNTSGNYCDKILIFQDVKKAKFSSPVQFLEEIKWLLHNAIIYFGGEQIFEMHLQYNTLLFFFLFLPYSSHLYFSSSFCI